MKKYRQIRKIKNRKFQILLSIKGIRKAKHKKRGLLKCINTNNLYHLSSCKENVRIFDFQTKREFNLQLLIGYSALFPNKTLDIKNEILHFSREMLIKMIFVLGRNYRMCKISDMKDKPFFSYLSSLSKERMERIVKYIADNNTSPEKVSYACNRTFLEFLKLVFGVKSEQCTTKYEDYVAEVKLFDLLLAINEQKVTCFNPSKKHPDDFARIMYANLYAANEFTNFNETLNFSEQMYYAHTFFEFITSRNEYVNIYNKFLERFKIEKWEEYYRTITMLGAMAYKNGEGVINLKQNDPNHLLNKNILETISIGENEYIEIDDKTNNENRDFVKFRSCPLIRLKDGSYMLYNKQLIIDRLYNSIYFDLLPYKLKYKDKNFNQFYKEIFVEKYLFDNTMLKCLKGRIVDVCFPKIEDIIKVDFVDRKEEVNQPDFYCREANDIFIFECKAVKLNGELKSDNNVDDIIDELENKLYIKRYSGTNVTRKTLTRPKAEGVGQLVNHIERLETQTFQWDKISPENVTYYPILVLESSEIVRAPLSTLANEWYQKQLSDTSNIDNKKCKPLIVMTIKTLFLYDELFRKEGFKYYFDKFIRTHKQKIENESFAMTVFEDFDIWMRSNFKTNKQSYFLNIVENLKKE